MSTGGLTLDRFLGGRVVAAQPADGFRAGHDTVLLAAAVPAEPGSTVLELGSGVGIASLCLAARVPGVRIVGVEIDPDLVRLANDNAAHNDLSARVSFIAADASNFDASVLQTTSPLWGGRSAAATQGASGGGPSHEEEPVFDHVFFNPPFHPDSAHSTPMAARDRATHDSSDAIRAWTGRALSFVRQGGTVTAIVRADRAEDILSVARDYRSIVFPLFPRRDAKPKRAIVRIAKLENPGMSYAAGLVLHEADGRNTEAAEAVLRHAHPLW